MFTVWAYELDDDGTLEGFDIGSTLDSLEATFLARDEITENPAASVVCVTDADASIIYVIDRITGASGYVSRRDGRLVTSWREAVALVAQPA